MIDRFIEPDPDALSQLNQRVKLFRESARLRNAAPAPADEKNSLSSLADKRRAHTDLGYWTSDGASVK